MLCVDLLEHDAAANYIINSLTVPCLICFLDVCSCGIVDNAFFTYFDNGIPVIVKYISLRCFSLFYKIRTIRKCILFGCNMTLLVSNKSHDLCTFRYRLSLISVCYSSRFNPLAIHQNILLRYVVNRIFCTFDRRIALLKVWSAVLCGIAVCIILCQFDTAADRCIRNFILVALGEIFYFAILTDLKVDSPLGVEVISCRSLCLDNIVTAIRKCILDSFGNTLLIR